MTYDEILSSMPVGLDRAVLSILSQREGMDAAIKKHDMMQLLRNMGFKADERQVRLAISRLRKIGHIIGSTNQAGYFMCSSRKEWAFVKDTEFLAKVGDIMDTIRTLDESARERWGDGYQEAMF